jgi:tRNA 5-methylaminomethyl-2-thiouridine biosynthesis bifunctional protein
MALMQHRATSRPVPDLLTACHLPASWSGQNAWTVLDTDYDQGHNFKKICDLWRSDARRPRMLHYVGIAIASPQGLKPGIHRFWHEAGRVSLTLCIGEMQKMLSDQHFTADTLIIGSVAVDKWAYKLLGRKCRKHTRFYKFRSTPQEHSLLKEAGFIENEKTTPYLQGEFNPFWMDTNNAECFRTKPTVSRQCAVLGSGISGAMVAQALVLRGWNVTVFEKFSKSSAGASGLPVGLVVPHVSADDSHRSRMSRTGTRLMRDLAQRYLVHGQDWLHSGVMERPALWHPDGAWIKPWALIASILGQPGISLRVNTDIKRVQRIGNDWHLFDAHQNKQGEFELVIFANAMDCIPLAEACDRQQPLNPQALKNITAMHPVHGTLSIGAHAGNADQYLNTIFPSYPVNGHGCFIPNIPGTKGARWYTGSTFETEDASVTHHSTPHRDNLEKLRQLLPTIGAALAPDFEEGRVNHWRGTRCVTHDRLPLVGSLHSGPHQGLWTIVGMGARGLSFSALCAELLVAKLGGEPLPVELALARSLDVQRIRRAPKLKRAAANLTPDVD